MVEMVFRKKTVSMLRKWGHLVNGNYNTWSSSRIHFGSATLSCLCKSSPALQTIRSVNCLGFNIDQQLTWDSHIVSMRQKVPRNIGILKEVRPELNTDSLIDIYRSLIGPYFTCCCIVWDSISETQIKNLQKLQNRVARMINSA